MAQQLVWKGQRPEASVLRERTKRELAIVRAEGYRAVKDAWGDIVIVQLGRVLRELAFPQIQTVAPTKKQGKQKPDESRWRFIPALIPTLKGAEELYWRQERVAETNDLRDVYTYFADLPRPARKAAEKDLVFTLVAKVFDGKRVFQTLYPRERAGELNSAKRKAGLLIKTRRNSSTPESWTSGTATRTVDRHPGAAAESGSEPRGPLRCHNPTPPHELLSRSAGCRLALALLGLLVLGHLNRGQLEAA